MKNKYRVWVDHTQHSSRRIKKWMFYVGYSSKSESSDTTSLIVEGEKWYLECRDKRKQGIKKCPLTDEDGSITHYKDQDAVIMIETGFKDMDGAAIWEGDVLGLYYNDQKDYVLGFVSIEQNQFVVFTEDSITFSWLYNIGPHCKVIGNIYENPELIEGLEILVGK